MKMVTLMDDKRPEISNKSHSFFSKEFVNGYQNSSTLRQPGIPALFSAEKAASRAIFDAN
jgi:hypothetical protein